MKIIIFRVDPTDISAKKEALLITCLEYQKELHETHQTSRTHLNCPKNVQKHKKCFKLQHQTRTSMSEEHHTSKRMYVREILVHCTVDLY